MSAADPRALALELVSDAEIRLEEIVDRAALGDLLASVHTLFGIGVRVYANDGSLLGASANDLEICKFVNELGSGRAACGATVTGAKNAIPGESGEATHPCFTGMAYHIVALEYEARRVGRIVMGPYAPSGLLEAPETLQKTEPKIHLPRANELLAREPRVKPEALARIARHLKTTLELVIFSSHKTWVTSKLHVYSVRESYRELEEKTKRLEQALTKLRELDRLKSNFLATVSHELRTPLTSIIGYSEMLAEGIAGPMTAEQSEFLKTIHSKGEQLLGLITGLLDLSKMESGTMALRKERVRVAAVLEEVKSTVAPAARKKGVEVLLEGTSAEADVTGDSERLRQVFVNLVDNALKFTPSSGTITMTVTVSAAADDDDDDGAVLLAPIRNEVVVRVADTGIGIPPRERERVFDAFYQVDSSSTRAYGGTGLGLSIVKRIVVAHGGQVSIEGNEPSGAVFVVRIPTMQAQRVLPSHVPPAATPAAE